MQGCVQVRSGYVALRSATILNDTLAYPLRRESKHKISRLNPKFKMCTIATTSHQKEINVKISLFPLSQQFKRLFSGTYFRCLKKLIITEISDI